MAETGLVRLGRTGGGDGAVNVRAQTRADLLQHKGEVGIVIEQDGLDAIRVEAGRRHHNNASARRASASSAVCRRWS